MISLLDLKLALPTKKRLQLDFSPGQFWAILGVNACGKTTLLETIAGLRKPLCGKVEYNGKNLHVMPARKRARAIGVLLQDKPNRFPEHVASFVMAGTYSHHTRHTSLSDLKATLTLMDLQTCSEHCVTQLSGGQWQRARLARLLIQAPCVYLLDEPLGHLDLHHQLKVMRYFRKLAQQGALVISVLHDVNLAMRFCDQAILMSMQETALVGSMAEVCCAANLQASFACSAIPLHSTEGPQWLFEEVG